MMSYEDQMKHRNKIDSKIIISQQLAYLSKMEYMNERLNASIVDRIFIQPLVKG